MEHIEIRQVWDFHAGVSQGEQGHNQEVDPGSQRMLKAIAHRDGTSRYNRHTPQAMSLGAIRELRGCGNDSLIFIQTLDVLDSLAAIVGLVISGCHRYQKSHHNTRHRGMDS